MICGVCEQEGANIQLNHMRLDYLPDMEGKPYELSSNYRYVHEYCVNFFCHHCDKVFDEFDLWKRKFFVFYLNDHWICVCKSHRSVYSCRQCGGLCPHLGIVNLGNVYYCSDHLPRLKT